MIVYVPLQFADYLNDFLKQLCNRQPKVTILTSAMKYELKSRLKSSVLEFTFYELSVLDGANFIIWNDKECDRVRYIDLWRVSVLKIIFF